MGAVRAGLFHLTVTAPATVVNWPKAVEILDAPVHPRRPDVRPQRRGGGGAVTGPRWPWAPLEEALGGGSWRSMAERLGVHDRQIGRWKAYGLGDDQTGLCAIRIGSHPAIV